MRLEGTNGRGFFSLNDQINYIVTKQYGEKRTGTNLLRKLLSENFNNVLVLMHVLGDKHSPRSSFDSLWETAKAEQNADLAFVKLATLATPARTTRCEDSRQLIYLSGIAKTVAHAFANKTMRFIISAKHPYSWITSMSRYEGWSTPRSSPINRSRFPQI